MNLWTTGFWRQVQNGDIWGGETWIEGIPEQIGGIASDEGTSDLTDVPPDREMLEATPPDPDDGPYPYSNSAVEEASQAADAEDPVELLPDDAENAIRQ